VTAPLFSLEGRTAVVTGGGRGIGRSIALGFAGAGADLILLGRPGSHRDMTDEAKSYGHSVTVVDLDLSEPAHAKAVGAQLAGDVDVDILVNNAGTIDRGDSTAVTPDAWNHVLQVNLSSLFFLTQQLAGPMITRRHGKIINIASLLSFQGGLRVASYAATKHAVAGLTRALANEWASHGIQVNAIAPGYIATDNTRPLREDPDRVRAITERIPAGRWGEADDVVGAAIFLASRASDYVNGHVLVVDGGWTAR